MTLQELNALPPDAAHATLLQCCGSDRWAAMLAARRPYESLAALLAAADHIWLQLGEADWLQAFAAHPRIGQRSESAAAQREQASVYGAADSLRRRLAAGNTAYEQKFGFIYIVFASGKTPEQMLELLERRLANTRAEELANAAAEQMKITRLRLQRLIDS